MDRIDFLLAFFNALAVRLHISLDIFYIHVFGYIIPSIILFYASISYFALYAHKKIRHRYISTLRLIALCVTFFLIGSFGASLLIVCL